jgi:hypothetical protein
MKHQSAPSQWETAAREEVVVDDEYRIYVGIDWATVNAELPRKKTLRNSCC